MVFPFFIESMIACALRTTLLDSWAIFAQTSPAEVFEIPSANWNSGTASSSSLSGRCIVICNAFIPFIPSCNNPKENNSKKWVVQTTLQPLLASFLSADTRTAIPEAGAVPYEYEYHFVILSYPWTYSNSVFLYFYDTRHAPSRIHPSKQLSIGCSVVKYFPSL